MSGTTDLGQVVSGSLTNRSGYDLKDAAVLVYMPAARQGDPTTSADGVTYWYRVSAKESSWKQGETIDLAKLALNDLGRIDGGKVGTVEMALRAIGWNMAKVSEMGMGRSRISDKLPMDKGTQMENLERSGLPQYLMYFLGDARNIDPLDGADRRELIRGIGRWTDCTKALRAAGALIVAHAEDVRSPVPLQVNDRGVEGKGNVYFAWVLPVAGVPPQVNLQPAPAGGIVAPGRGGLGGGRNGTGGLLPEAP